MATRSMQIMVEKFEIKKDVKLFSIFIFINIKENFKITVTSIKAKK